MKLTKAMIEAMVFSETAKVIGGMMFLFFVFYVVIGVVSLGQVATGESVLYMPFWHGPWRWWFNLFNQ